MTDSVHSPGSQQVRGISENRIQDHRSRDAPCSRMPTPLNAPTSKGQSPFSLVFSQALIQKLQRRHRNWSSGCKRVKNRERTLTDFANGNNCGPVERLARNETV